MSVVEQAKLLSVEIRNHSDQLERDRRLPLDLVERLTAAGLFQMCVPRSLGGLELEAGTLLQAIETIATADGSAGWCVMIGATSGLLSAYLPVATAREIYSQATISGGVFAPHGTAVVGADGYRVSGRWAFASGCQHCQWLMGGCRVIENGAPVVLPNGLPDPHLVLLPANEVEIIDTWDVSGLRGTGSHDIAIHERLVPRDRCVSLVSDKPQHDGVLYRFPVFALLALGIAAVALGIARRAIDELIAIAAAKTPSGSRRRLAERAAVQADVARAEGLWKSARTVLFQTIDETWRGTAQGDPIGLPQRAALRLAASHATDSAAQAVDLMYNAGGGTSVYARSPLQRCFRDVHVATQHIMVAAATYELAGRVLLGLETDASQL